MIRTIQTQDGPRYRVRVGKHGAQRTFSKLKDAQDYETEARRDADRARAGMTMQRQAITYDELCKLFLEGYEAKSKGWTQAMLGYSRDKFGKQLVRSIRPEVVRSWLVGLPYTDKTKKHILERMRVVLNAGVEWGFLERSPARPSAVRGFSGKRVEGIQPFESWAEVEAVASQLGQVDGAMVQFVCATGLRFPSEVKALRWADIDREMRAMVVHGTKTSAAARAVPLSQMALNALDTLTHQNDLVFPLADFYGWRRWQWRAALTAAGLELRPPYQMRHTFATLALSAGVPLDVVANWMGHTDLGITRQYYAKYIRPTTERYAALLDNLKETA